MIESIIQKFAQVNVELTIAQAVIVCLLSRDDVDVTLGMIKAVTPFTPLMSALEEFCEFARDNYPGLYQGDVDDSDTYQGQPVVWDGNFVEFSDCIRYIGGSGPCGNGWAEREVHDDDVITWFTVRI